MTGKDQSGGYRDVRPEQQGGAYDSERIRQAQQAERGAPQADQHGSLEPRDSRNVTGMQGGTGEPGGAFQQEGSARWGGDAQQGQQAAARQPDGTTAAGQQPGIDRREMQAEQQAQQPRQAGHTTPEGEHMAAAHVPHQQHAQMGQAMSQAGMQQSMGGMGQAFSAEEAARAPQARGFVDQQSASMGGLDQPQQGQSSGQGRGSGRVGSDDQVESMIGVGEQDLSSGSSGQHEQFAGGGGQMGGSGRGGGTVAGQIREHMEVVGADDVHLGTVDAVEGDRIKLTKRDSDAGYEGGQHHGHHHYISCGLVAAVEGNRVRLSATAANAYAMEEEK